MIHESDSKRARAPWVWGGAVLFLGIVTAGLVGASILLWMAIDVEALIRSGGDAPPPVKEIVARVELPELP
ncbi:MAG: hypothetical protein V3U38_02860, partial [Gemmatimonadota bacterium]